MTEADLALLGAKFTDPVSFSEMAAESSVVTYLEAFTNSCSYELRACNAQRRIGFEKVYSHK